MKNKFRPFYLILFSFIIFLISCEKTLKYNFDIPENEKKIVVNSVLCPDSLVKVNISKSMSIRENNNSFQYLDNAEAKLFENDVLIETLHYTKNGNYFSSDFKPEENKKYEIKVSVPNMNNVDANTVIPAKTNIISVDTLTVIDHEYEYDEKKLEFNIKFKDNIEIDNYYQIECRYSYKEIYGDEDVFYKDYIEADEEILNIQNIDGTILLEDKIIAGEDFNLKFRVPIYIFTEQIKEYRIYLNSISKEYYLYLVTRSAQEETEDNPFAEPVQVFNNINNGCGICGSYSSDVKSFIFNY